MKPAPSTRRKWILAAIKLLIVVLVVWFIRREIGRACADLHEHPPQFQPGWLVASGALYLLALLPAGVFWRQVLRALGQETAMGQTLRAYFIGHLGKYVPGKAMVVVLRAGMLRGRGVETSLAAVSVFVETLTMMAVGACIAALILLASPIEDPRYSMYVLGAVGCVCATVPPTLPPIFRRLVPFLGVGRSNLEVVKKLGGLTGGVLAAGWVAMTIMWLIMGVSVWAAVRGVGFEAGLLDNLHRYVAAIALATVIGFLTMVPAGFGTRDAALFAMLEPCLGVGVAGGVTAVLRLVSILAELAISCVLALVGRAPPPTNLPIER